MPILDKYGFTDRHGHPLANCVDYQDMLTALRDAERVLMRAEELMLEALTPHETSNGWRSLFYNPARPLQSDCVALDVARRDVLRNIRRLTREEA